MKGKSLVATLMLLGSAALFNPSPSFTQDLNPIYSYSVPSEKDFAPPSMEAKFDLSFLTFSVKGLRVKYISDNGQEVSVYYENKGMKNGIYEGELKPSEESLYPNTFVPDKVKVLFYNLKGPIIEDIINFFKHTRDPEFFDFQIEYYYHGKNLVKEYDVLKEEPNGFFYATLHQDKTTVESESQMSTKPHEYF